MVSSLNITWITPDASDCTDGLPEYPEELERLTVVDKTPAVMFR